MYDNGQREADLASISLLSRKLDLFRRGMISDQTEGDIRKQIGARAASVFDINRSQLSQWSTLTTGVVAQYDSLVVTNTTQTSMSLVDALNAYPAKADQIVGLPLADITGTAVGRVRCGAPLVERRGARPPVQNRTRSCRSSSTRSRRCAAAWTR